MLQVRQLLLSAWLDMSIWLDMSNEERFYNLLLCSTGTVSLVCYFMGAYWFDKVGKKVTRVTKGLRTFGNVMGILFLLMPLSSIGTSVYCMFYDNFDSPTSYRARSLMAFATQIIDMGIIVVSIDCAVASLSESQRPLLKTKLHGSVAAFDCVVMAWCVTSIYFGTGVTFTLPFAGFVTLVHILCFSLEAFLLHLNICYHKEIPLNYDLTARLNLARNIGLLNFFCPYLLIVTMLTSLGPLVFLYAKYTPCAHISQIARVSILYSCYNLAHITVAVIFIYSSIRRNREQEQGERILRTVTGRVIEPRQTSEGHFRDLDYQWSL
uniref:G_PROTEIN_RECEP_F1_2 domain-containing protein n=1 Tax=Panagrellus redivivus TaxID=6233 RepID=A0A7E4ZVK2_PANRE